MRKLILFLTPVLWLCGCAGSVFFGHTIGQAAPHEQPAPAAHVAVGSVRTATVVFTADAKQKINTDPRFNADVLLAAIDGELRSHDLIDANGDTHAQRTIEIVIGDFSTRPASNAALFGYAFSNATLTGDVEVRDSAGRELRRLKIKAVSRLTTAANSEQPPPLDSLYRRFAQLTVSKLTGVPIKEADTEVPR